VIAYLDTNVVLRLGQGNLKRISSTARDVLQSADLFISPMVLIELEYLHEIGRVRLGARDVLRKLSQEIGLTVCDLSFPSVAEAALDEKWTRDPFDRAIVAQAKANGLALLISADEEIRQHYPRAIW
jgi:PIN domain nuclease of toxin-antitoxin system